MDLPHLARQALNFVPALTRHVLEGCPLATQEEIEVRFLICMQCPHQTFEHGYSECSLCLCHVNQGTARNKLMWADTHCPDTPPRWTSLINLQPPLPDGINLDDRSESK